MGESLEDLQSASGSLLKTIGNIVGKAIEGTEIEVVVDGEAEQTINTSKKKLNRQ